jgi:hypothetical protein
MRDILLGLFLYLALAACATHDVRCDGPLQPINVRPPAPDARTHPTAADQRASPP